MDVMKSYLLQMRNISAIFLVLLFLFVTLSGTARAEHVPQREKTVTVGVVPLQAALKMAEKWVPFCKYLERKTGLKVKFRTARSIADFKENVEKKKYDIVYIDPVHYTKYAQPLGYKAFSKVENQALQSIIVTQKNSRIKTIEDLLNARMAFPFKRSSTSTLISEQYLENNNIWVSPVYVTSHDSVYETVSKGLYVAGSGDVYTFNTQPEEVKSNLTVLWESPQHTSNPFAYLEEHLSVDDVANLRRVMIDMKKDEVGRNVLAGLSFEGIEAAVDDDWNSIRALTIFFPDME